MAPKQSQDIYFNQGLNQGIAAEVLPPGQLTELENMYFNKTGKLSKRNGYSVLQDDRIDSSTVSEIKAGATFKDELLLLTDGNIYSYNETEAKWLNKDFYRPVTLRNKPVLGGTIPDRYNLDVVYCNGYYVYIYLNKNDVGTLDPGLYYTVTEADTGQVIQADVNISGLHTSFQHPTQLVVLGTNVCIVYGSNTAGYISMLVLDMTDPDGTGSTVHIVTDGYATYSGRFFDVCAVNDTTACLAYTAAPSDTNAVLFTVAGATATTYNNTNQYNVYCVEQDLFGDYYIVVSDSGVIKVIVLDRNFDYVNTTTIDTQTITQVTATTTDFSTRLHVFMEVYASQTSEVYIKDFVIDNNGSIVTASADFQRGVGIASKAFRYVHPDNTGVNYIFTVHSHETALGSYGPYLIQNTLFLLDENANVIGRTLEEVAGWTNQANRVSRSNVNNPSSGVYTIASVKLGNVEMGLGSWSRDLTDGAALVTLDFNGSLSEPTNINGQLFVPGGYLYMYDGNILTEAGFHVWPQYITLTAGTGGDLTTESTYSYKVVYEWVDFQGRVHRSAPSQAESVTLTGAQSKVTLQVPMLRLTNKTYVLIQIYRTQAGGSTYNFCASVENDPTSDSTTYADDLADEEIAENTALYSDTEAENLIVPECRAMTTWQNRLFSVAEDNVVYLSKEAEEGKGIEFGDGSAFYLETDPVGGKITDISAFTNKLIIPKENKLFSVYGMGPNAAGSNSQYSKPELMPSNVGVKDGSRIVNFGQGLILPTRKGLYYTDGNSPPFFIGNAVEDYKDDNVLSSIVEKDEQYIYIQLDDGDTVLAYDIYRQQWSEYLNHNALGFISWNNTLSYVSDSTLPIYYKDTSFTDNTTYIDGKVTTGWMNLAGLNGYYHLHKIHILGDYKSAHTLNVTLSYPKYDDETKSKSITSDPGEYLYTIVPTHPKTRAIKISIYDSNQAGTGESFELLGLRLVWSPKRKTQRTIKI